MQKNTKIKKPIDGRTQGGESWLYSEEVKEHFFNPRNFMRHGEEETFKFNGMGRAGSPACGDEMVIWIQVDKKTDPSSAKATEGEERIKDVRWRTFGCGSAIASTSALSEMLIEDGGLAIDDALKIKPQDIIERLGSLPDRKVHCSVLGDKAFQAAANDYFRNTGQHDRVIIAGSKVIDKELKITDKNIEEAVLEGVSNLEELQKKLKIEKINKDSIPEIEELIKFYNEKYFD